MDYMYITFGIFVRLINVSIMSANYAFELVPLIFEHSLLLVIFNAIESEFEPSNSLP